MLTTLASRYSRQFASAAARTFASQGEVVLVTGASSGVGYDTAKVLAASGYRVVGAARRVEQLGALVAEIEEAGGTAAACYLDVTQEETYETLFKFAEARFGGVDHVFLNAGAGGLFKGPADMEGPEDTGSFRHGLDVNVIGAVLGMKHSIAALRKSGGGSIVLNSSQAGGASRGLFSGVIGDLTIINAYCLTSAAIDQLVRMAAYYQNENIRVYGLKPAIFKSDMSDEWVKLGRESGFSPDMDDEILADFNFFFKGIMGDPKHIGCVVETLINNTTKYVAGSNIGMDNDSTYSSSHEYEIADTDGIFPEMGLEDLRGYDGGEYSPQEERTAAFIENLNKKE